MGSLLLFKCTCAPNRSQGKQKPPESPPQKITTIGRLGGSVGEASAFGSGRDPRVLGSSPTSGSLLSGASASPSASASPPAYTLSVSNKIFSKIFLKKQEESIKEFRLVSQV